MRLQAHEFLRRFLQHVLPKGLHRVRSFGLWHPSRRDTLQRLQLLLDDGRGAEPVEAEPAAPRWRCPHCRQGTLLLVRHLCVDECFALLASLASTSLPSARGPPAPVELGAASEGRRPVLKGLAEGTPVVVEGAFHLNNECKRAELE